MEYSAFYINHQFLVEPATHLVTEMNSAQETRLEPRLMKLLCLLAERAETVIQREYLIQEIWGDYGGGDEGLTQAISFLRKTLNDTDKKMIATIPKQGYILHATITNAPISKINPIHHKKRTYLVALFTIIFILLITGAVITIYSRSNGNSARSDSQANLNTEIQFPDLQANSTENYYNTVTTTDSAGVTYRLVLIGDRRPQFYINNQLQPDDIPSKYFPLLDQLKQELQRRKKTVE
ncbi:MAG: transcriptional regulator [Saprospiraceae bacterium]